MPPSNMRQAWMQGTFAASERNIHVKLHILLTCLAQGRSGIGLHRCSEARAREPDDATRSDLSHPKWRQNLLLALV